MLTRENMQKLAESRGFGLWAILDGGRRLQLMDKRGINLIVNQETLEFEFAWMVPHSICQITCPKCSPFTNDDHFNKIYRQFRGVVATYKEGMMECDS